MTARMPNGLGYQGQKLFKSVTGEFDLDCEPDKLRILFDAAKLADTIDQLEKGLRGQPLTVRGSAQQVVIHPIISELRFSRSQLASLLGKLNFEQSSTED